MLDLLKNLFQNPIDTLTKSLQAQILVFGTLIEIILVVLLLLLPNPNQTAILAGMLIVFLVTAGIYVLVEQPAVKPAQTAPVIKESDAVAQTQTTAAKSQNPAGSSSASATTTVISLDSLRDAYLDSLVVDCQRARLVGIDPKSADPRRKAFSLDKLYISLDTQTQVEVEPEKGKKNSSTGTRGKETRPLSVLEVLNTAEKCRMVLLGLPGSGKTTFVRYLSRRHAQACRRTMASMTDDLPGWQGAPLLPVIIPLGRLAESFPLGTTHGSAELVGSFLRQTLKAISD